MTTHPRPAAPSRMHTNAYALLLALAIALYACGGEPAASKAAAIAPPFFDLKGYFDQEAKRLDAAQGRVRKLVRLDGVEEVQETDSVDYADVLAIFSNSDINRPAWYDHYAIDSIFMDDRLAGISYMAQKEDLRTRAVTIQYAPDGQIAVIEIDNLTASTVARTQQQLNYRPGQGFTVANEQSIPLADAQNLYIAVEFLQ